MEAAAGGSADYAGWWRRAAALLIDGLILSIPYGVGVALALAAGETRGALLAAGGILIVVAIVAPFVYFPYLHSRESGQTIGKRALGIAVRSEERGRLSGGHALARYAITLVFALLLYVPLLVNYLWPLWDDRNQALHDKVARSVVVRA